MKGRFITTHSRSVRALTATQGKRLANIASRGHDRRLREALMACEIKERQLLALRQEQEQMQQIVEGAASRVLEEQERIEAVLSALGQGLFGLDASGCAQFMNPACERMLGWREEQ